jgi:hypothetical protein
MLKQTPQTVKFLGNRFRFNFQFPLSNHDVGNSAPVLLPNLALLSFGSTRMNQITLFSKVNAKSITIFRFLIAFCFIGLIAGCGGGGELGKAPPNGPVVAESITLTTDRTTIKSGNIDNVAVLTAKVIAQNGGPVPNVVVSFQSDSGEILDCPCTTDASGTATAQLSYGNDKTNRTLSATASVDNGNQNIVTSSALAVAVTGTTMQLSNPAQVAQHETQTVSATVLDADSQPTGGVTVALSSANGNTIDPSSVASLSDGTANFAFTGEQLGADTLTATIAEAPTQTGALTVTMPSTTSLTLTASRSTIQSGSTNNKSDITVIARDINHVVIPNLPVTLTVNNGGVFQSNGNTSVLVNTNANGAATATVGYGSDKSNRVLKVSATAAGVSSNTPITVMGTTLMVRITPTLISGGSSSGWKFVLTDADGAPIQNAPLQPSISGSDNTALDYNLNPFFGALPVLTTDATGSAPFTIHSQVLSVGTILLIKAAYGTQTQVNTSSIQQADAEVTAKRGTNFQTTSTVDGGYDYGWIVPTQSGGQGPTALTTTAGITSIIVNATNSTGSLIPISLQAERHSSGCSTQGMNYSVSCNAGNKLVITYSAANNPNLPTGVYQGSFNVQGFKAGVATPFETKIIYVKIIK